MLEKAFEWIESKTYPNFKEIYGKTYVDKDMKELAPACYQNAIKTNSLTSIIDYVTSYRDIENSAEELIIHIHDADEVTLYSTVDVDKQRHHYLEVTPILPSFEFGHYYSTEKFIIFLKTAFIQTEETTALIDLLSNLNLGDNLNLKDDGITQTVTIKSGVHELDRVKVPNPIKLTPYRTFLEVGQPASEFIFRLDTDGRPALHEADGGMWRIAAKNNIKTYLESNIEEIDESLADEIMIMS